jgi:cytochrome b561
MSLFGTELRYGAVAQIFHWLTVILVLGAWLVAEGDRSPTIALHETLGLAVIVLTILRLLWRFADRQPDPVPMPRVMAIASKSLQGLLFLLLLGLPISGALGTQLEGHPLLLFGAQLGPFVERSRALAHNILEVHQLLGDAIIWLAGLHAVAALLHHFLMKDRVLKQMLPGPAA